MKQEEIKIGLKVSVEQAWEDSQGYYHDEVATIKKVNDDGTLELEFDRKDITDFLEGAEYRAENIEQA